MADEVKALGELAAALLNGHVSPERVASVLRCYDQINKLRKEAK